MRLRSAVAVSATAHGALFLWAAIAGWLPDAPPEDNLQVAAVSVISSSDFDALISNAPPSAEPPAPVAPQAPAEAEAPPDLAPEAPPPAPVARPDTPDQATPDANPDVATLIAPPVPDQVADETPEAPAPPASAPDAPLSDTPSPREAPRVASVPQPAPPPATEAAPVRQAPPQPAETDEDVAPAESEAAPEEAAPVIVTEADEPGRAPETSVRPPRKPTPPVVTAAASENVETPEPAEDPAPEAAPQSDAISDAVAGALAEAVEAPAAPAPAPSGPPLTQGERDGLRVAVSRCWNLGSLSTEAMRTTVTIAMEMNRDGTPLSNTIRLIGSQGGGEAAANQAFEAGRRAILRCGSGGFDLPDEKFAHWREIEMTFNPEEMRQR